MQLIELLFGPTGVTLTALLLAIASTWLIRKALVSWKESDNQFLRNSIYQAVALPLLVTPWLLLFIYFLHHFVDHQGSEWHDGLGIAEKILAVLLPAWMIVRITRQFPAMAATMSKPWLDNSSASVLSRLVQILVIVVGGLILAQSLGYSISALLTFGGIGGIVVGFAAKDWLANFFGGLMLMLDRPFKEGDWVRSPDRNIEGHVEQIGWRLTRIRSFDRRPVFVPNSVFSNIVLENASRMRNRRLVETFGLRYEDIDRLPTILSSVTACLAEHPEIDNNETSYARFIRYGDSALECQVRCHVIPTSRTEFLRVKEELLLKIAGIVKHASADFAYPVIRVVSESSKGKV